MTFDCLVSIVIGCAGEADVAAVPDALAPNRLPTITMPIW